jgi:diguanylate cyclase (GGDEF)-like protein
MSLVFGKLLVEHLRRENERLWAENSKLAEISRRDDLTGLYNARALREELHQLVGDGILRPSGALLFIDVDYFKSVNETHGHTAASAILGDMGRLIASCLEMDQKAYRYGGDEFVLLSPGKMNRAWELGERVRCGIEAHSFGVQGLAGAGRVKVTVSVGLCAIKSGQSAKDLLDAADRALFAAKRGSRNACIAA